MRGQNGQDFESPVQENLSSRDFRIISDSIRYDQILKITRTLLGIKIQVDQKVTVYIRFIILDIVSLFKSFFFNCESFLEFGANILIEK